MKTEVRAGRGSPEVRGTALLQIARRVCVQNTRNRQVVGVAGEVVTNALQKRPPEMRER
jgi:hypothetical protein